MVFMLRGAMPLGIIMPGCSMLAVSDAVSRVPPTERSRRQLLWSQSSAKAVARRCEGVGVVYAVRLRGVLLVSANRSEKERCGCFTNGDGGQYKQMHAPGSCSARVSRRWSNSEWGRCGAGAGRV